MAQYILKPQIMPNPNVRLRRARLASSLPAMQALAAGGADRALEVSAVRSFPLREPVSKRAYTVVRVETRGGLAGYGECHAVPAAEFARASERVRGTPASAYEVVRRALAGMPGMQAAVNMALLDIMGKQSKAPVFQILGGPTRNKVRAMTKLAGEDNGALTASMKRATDAGFRAFVVPLPKVTAPNQGRAFVLAVRGRLEALRAAGGEDVDFVMDGAAELSPGDASSISTDLQPLHPLWIDEPCAPLNLGAVRKITRERVTPVGFGRTVDNGADFQDLLREEALDVLRPDIARNGISQIRRMAALAETYYVAVAPYHDGGPVGTAAALHLAASIPNFFIQQVPLPEAEEDRRMRTEIAGPDAEPVKDGFAQLSAAPGLGITVNEQALEKYAEREA
ncbi:MAG: mandelate racemase/muconate lactonizing enzyme family protein [Bryobacteraceae bacterium]